MKLWGGRFKESGSEIMEKFNSSFPTDKVMWKEDLEGSRAHGYMLKSIGILSEGEWRVIKEALDEIEEEIISEKLKLEGKFEDIHSFIEFHLTEKIGSVGKKIHTARSRNDQVNLDMKLYFKKEGELLVEKLENLISILEKVGIEKNCLLPGYTHWQRAQVITLKHYFNCYKSMFKRDIKRFENAVELFMEECPLGAGALAGSTLELDRDLTAKLLGFESSHQNSLDGVSDRDYIIEMISCSAITMMHLSRMSEELIVWNTKEFNFIQLPEEYTTGSSLMPHKKNPDSLELIRGRTGRVYGNLMGMLTVMKALPLAYNKDMQEDKTYLMESLEVLNDSLAIMTSVLEGLKVNKVDIEKSISKGFLNATELADYMVLKGMTFREAHHLVGAIVLYCEENKKELLDMTLEEFQGFSSSISEDVYNYLDYNHFLKMGTKKDML